MPAPANISRRATAARVRLLEVGVKAGWLSMDTALRFLPRCTGFSINFTNWSEGDPVPETSGNKTWMTETGAPVTALRDLPAPGGTFLEVSSNTGAVILCSTGCSQVTIPNGLPRNFRCRVINNQSGTLTFNPSGPTTINGSGTSRTIATPSSPNHTWADIMHVLGGDDYTLVGSALT